MIQIMIGQPLYFLEVSDVLVLMAVALLASDKHWTLFNAQT